MSKFIFTDVHGCGRELESLISPHTSGEIISLGDNFDRGLEGVLVWDIIQHYHIKSLLGNHELKMLDYLLGKRKWLPKHYYYFLNEFSKCYNISVLIEWLESLPLMITFDNYILVHGGIIPSDPYKQDVSANVYGNFNPGKPMPSGDDSPDSWWNIYDGDAVVVYGHISHTEPLIKSNSQNKVNSVCLDTSAVHGNRLTGALIDGENMEFSSTKTKNYYRQMKAMDIPEFKIK